MKLKLFLKNKKVVDNYKTGAQARLYRQSAGVSQSALAKRMGMKPPNLSNLEKGIRGNWSENLLLEYKNAVDELKTAALAPARC